MSRQTTPKIKMAKARAQALGPTPRSIGGRWRLVTSKLAGSCSTAHQRARRPPSKEQIVGGGMEVCEGHAMRVSPMV